MNISGDKINKIEAVISGSLNFIFNEYNGENIFSDVVPQQEGRSYTEPNPMIDLSGLDVMRKILILTRESGFERELSDITFNGFLPEECASAESVPAFFESLTKHEAHFKALYKSANDKGNKLKVLASMEMGEMSVSLQEIPPHSPFFNLEGKDNVVAINSNRYLNEPLVIKGAGAGCRHYCKWCFCRFDVRFKQIIMNSIKAFAPATIANFNVGYDVLGLSLNGVGDEVELTFNGTLENKIIDIINGANLPKGVEENCCSVVIRKMQEALNDFKGVDIIITKGFSSGSGLAQAAQVAPRQFMDTTN